MIWKTGFREKARFCDGLGCQKSRFWYDSALDIDSNRFPSDKNLKMTIGSFHCFWSKLYFVIVCWTKMFSSNLLCSWLGPFCFLACPFLRKYVCGCLYKTESSLFPDQQNGNFENAGSLTRPYERSCFWLRLLGSYGARCVTCAVIYQSQGKIICSILPQPVISQGLRRRQPPSMT